MARNNYCSSILGQLLALISCIFFTIRDANAECIPNGYVTALSFIFPAPESCISETFYVQMTADVYDPDAFVAVNEDFSFTMKATAHLTNGQNIVEHDEDGIGVFETTSMRVTSMASFSIDVSLVHRDRGSLCSVSRTVDRCTENVNDIVQQYKDDHVAAFLKFSSERTVSGYAAQTVLKPLEVGPDMVGSASKDENVVAALRDSSGLLPPLLQEESTRWTHHNNAALRLARHHAEFGYTSMIVIGIKSHALNARMRQAIRETWFQWINKYNNEVAARSRRHRRSSSFSSNSHKSSSDGVDDKVVVVAMFYIGESAYCNNASRRRSTDDKKRSNSDASVCDQLYREQAMFNDLLLGEDIPAQDSYFSLTKKTLLFLKWTTEFHQKVNLFAAGESIKGATSTSDTVNNDNIVPFLPLGYVVISDDDVYIDIVQLMYYLSRKVRGKYIPVSRGAYSQQQQQQHTQQQYMPPHFYAGEVFAKRLKYTYKPIRDPTHANYLSERNFPMNELPPYAAGNMYILSYGLVDFISSNSDALQPVGTLEDLSVAVWLWSLQSFPTHMEGVCDLTKCSEVGGNKYPPKTSVMFPPPWILQRGDSTGDETTAHDELSSLSVPVVATSEKSLLSSISPDNVVEFFRFAQFAVSSVKSHELFHKLHEDYLSIYSMEDEHSILSAYYQCSQKNRKSASNTFVNDTDTAVAGKDEDDDDNGCLLRYRDSSSSLLRATFLEMKHSDVNKVAVAEQLYYKRLDETALDEDCRQHQPHQPHLLQQQNYIDDPVYDKTDVKLAVLVTPGAKYGVSMIEEILAVSSLSHQIEVYEINVDELGPILPSIPSMSRDKVANIMKRSLVPLRGQDGINGNEKKYHRYVLLTSILDLGDSDNSSGGGRIDSNYDYTWSGNSQFGFESVVYAVKTMIELEVFAFSNSSSSTSSNNNKEQTLSVIFLNGEPVGMRSMACVYNVNTLLLTTLTTSDSASSRTTNAATSSPISKKNNGNNDAACSLYELYLPVHSSQFGEMQYFVPANRLQQAGRSVMQVVAPIFASQTIESNVNNQPSSGMTEHKYKSPLELLHGNNKNNALLLQSKTKDVAYLYNKCKGQQRHVRELFVEMLQSAFTARSTEIQHETSSGSVYSSKNVVMLGACRGAAATAVPGEVSHVAIENEAQPFESSRFDEHYLDRAVELYKPYKFVIAFENTRAKGYITEKLTSAYLADAVPIYFGAPDIGEYFNVDSMVLCHPEPEAEKLEHMDSHNMDEGSTSDSSTSHLPLLMRGLQRCAEKVVELLYDDAALRTVLSAHRIAGRTAEERKQKWQELYSWHPDTRLPLSPEGDNIEQENFISMRNKNLLFDKVRQLLQ